MKKQRKRYLLVALAIIGLFLFASAAEDQEYALRATILILVWPIAA